MGTLTKTNAATGSSPLRSHPQLGNFPCCLGSEISSVKGHAVNNTQSYRHYIDRVATCP